MIAGFADSVTEKIFLGEELSRKEIGKLGDLDVDKAQERLAILNQTSERNLLALPMLHYHALHGTNRYSINANSRRSKWRIAFTWNEDRRENVEFVQIENTH